MMTKIKNVDKEINAILYVMCKQSGLFSNRKSTEFQMKNILPNNL